ncbi:heavy metal-responsive transcriptional regulator [Leptolyngbya sp. FACHB-261]|uniref:heavy metal-responsive transcriptional regulator n=1 Tax=Leptolyngbya sp. FACHB-261 TaxID=2692806 RepID=UPI0016839BE9|nr:heavy metal-responsive transcriptional regulator [Leptolyngbya sp. FACHB-261]MBD2103059.1 heavy metal-responsive transcriptional regulator [Leptolyngbya sp. FACHB-261]
MVAFTKGSLTESSNQSSNSKLLKIGELATQAEVAVGTIRYYETLGLIEPASRSESGYRYYNREAVRRLQFIRKAQSLQFSLSEIQQILGVRRRGDSACPMVQDLLNQKISHLEEQIYRTTTLKAELETYRDKWADEPLSAPRSQELCHLIEEVTYGDVPVHNLISH